MRRDELLAILHSELRTYRSKWFQPKPGTSIESLCLPMLALWRDNTNEREQRLSLILNLQGRDGAWPAVVGDEEPSSWTLTALLLTTTRRDDGRLRRAMEWLIQSKGREANWFWRWKFRNLDTEVKFDPAKYGWTWIPGSTSWVVPTAMSIVALERVRRAQIITEQALNERIDIGIAMLLDRMCPGGGWNAGNGIAFGVALAPYIDATAIGLLALQRHEHEGVTASLSQLTTVLPECPSPYSIAWGILALTLHCSRISVGGPLQQASDLLISTISRNRKPFDTSTLAICALALSALSGDNVFSVST
jgi:hypothetical protein